MERGREGEGGAGCMWSLGRGEGKCRLGLLPEIMKGWWLHGEGKRVTGKSGDVADGDFSGGGRRSNGVRRCAVRLLERKGEGYGGFRWVAGVYGGSPGSGGFCGGVSGERGGRRVCSPEKTRERRKGRGMRRLRLREGKNEVNVRVLG
ncbi:hypothetical protein HAX54_039355, partial [Datura stramonium]|nr:hypothetical protein [Datura stramonium]